ncbi:MAG: hypothetical protein KDD35_08565 [Bdellovibrionales bacterium]|nr:hypothetical protein [Bdellovibrionales bacterium]
MLEQVRVCMVVICVVGFLFQFCLGQSDAQAKEEGASQIDKEEFEQRLRDLNNRFRDFYLHRRYRLEENERRLEAADDYRDRRQKREEKIEAQRKEFIRLRDAAPVLENNEEEHLKEKEEEIIHQEKARLDYIRRRKEIERIRGSARLIPEGEDVGLVDPLEE